MSLRTCRRGLFCIAAAIALAPPTAGAGELDDPSSPAVGGQEEVPPTAGGEQEDLPPTSDGDLEEVPPTATDDEEEAPTVDSCNAEMLDNYTLQVVCGYTVVPKLDIEVETKYDEASNDPFDPTPIEFVSLGEPWVLDLRKVEKLSNAPYFECFGKPTSTHEVDGHVESERFEEVYAAYTVERVAHDLYRVALGKQPLCYDVLGSEDDVAAGEEFEFEPAAGLSGTAGEATADLSPIELENLSRSFEMEVLVKPSEVKVSAPEELAAREAEEAEEAKNAPRQLVGMGFRQEYNRLGRCPKRFKNFDALESFVRAAGEDDYDVDYTPLVARSSKSKVMAGEVDVSVICSYNAHLGLWTGADFFCKNATTCYSQMQPSLPRDCQKIERASVFTDEWTVASKHCMHMGAGRTDKSQKIRGRYLSMGHGVYLLVLDTGSPDPTYGLVFAKEPAGGAGER